MFTVSHMVLSLAMVSILHSNRHINLLEINEVHLCYARLNSNTTDVIIGAGTANPSGAPVFTTGVQQGLCSFLCSVLYIILSCFSWPLYCLSFYYLELFITGTRIPDPLFSHLVPPAIMVWIFDWKYIFEPFIHILQHFVLQLSRSTNFCFQVQLPYYL